MADLVTLQTLRQRAKQAANMERSNFVQADEWTGYINYAAKRMYDVLVSKFGDDYNLLTATVVVANGTDKYLLPDDFYRMVGVDLLLTGNNQPITLARYSFRERNKYNWFNINWGIVGGAPMWRLEGQHIKFLPTPSVSGPAVRLYYIPTLQVYKQTGGGGYEIPLGGGIGAGNNTYDLNAPTSSNLIDDTDAIDGVNGFDELIVVEAAILARQKEGTETDLLERRKTELLAWIDETAAQRNAGDPMYVGDQQPNNGSMFAQLGFFE